MWDRILISYTAAGIGDFAASYSDGGQDRATRCRESIEKKPSIRFKALSSTSKYYCHVYRLRFIEEGMASARAEERAAAIMAEARTTFFM